MSSKFAHTPGWMERAKHTRLRAKSPVRNSTKKTKKVATRKFPTSSKTGRLSLLICMHALFV